VGPLEEREREREKRERKEREREERERRERGSEGNNGSIHNCWLARHSKVSEYFLRTFEPIVWKIRLVSVLVYLFSSIFSKQVHILLFYRKKINYS